MRHEVTMATPTLMLGIRWITHLKSAILR